MTVHRLPPTPWELSSNSGWDRVRGRLRGAFTRDGEVWLLASMRIRSESWAVPDGLDRHELAGNSLVVLPQVEILRRNLEAAQAALALWLDTPREIETVWNERSTQYFAVSLQRRADTICSLEKPVCRICYQIGRMTAEHLFVVDQSCIRLFTAGLDTWLRVSRGVTPPVE